MTVVVGRVLNNSRRGIKNVSISCRGHVVSKSKADGVFSFKLDAGAPRDTVTFEADGYVTNTRVFDTNSNGYLSVTLWPVTYKVGFDISQGLEIELGKSKISVPPSAFVDERGVVLSGRSTLLFTLLDITNRDQLLAAPGDFYGRLKSGNVEKLKSFGVFDLRFTVEKHNTLSLAKGKQIGLAIRIPERTARRAPKEIPFFNFDKTTGLWQQISAFTYDPSNLTYNGSTTSFGGAHNLDDPANGVCITVRTIDINTGLPLANASVTLTGGQYAGYGTTDANGYVCLIAEKNESVSITATALIGASHYATPVPLVVTTPNFTSGASDCGNEDRCPFVGNVELDLLVGF